MTDSQTHDTRFLQSTSKHISPHFCEFNFHGSDGYMTSKDKYQREDSQPKYSCLTTSLLQKQTSDYFTFYSRAINGYNDAGNINQGHKFAPCN